MKKIWTMILAVAMTVGLLSGCQKSTNENAYSIYYLNLEVTSMTPIEYIPEADTLDPQEMVTEFFEALQRDPVNDKYIRTIPDSVMVNSYSFVGKNLNIDFGESYSSLTTSQEILIRTAIVRTMVQIDGVNSVSFSVEDDPLLDANGEVVGYLNEDSFVENPGEQINSSQKVTVSMFFSNSAGTGLVKREATFKYSTNVPLEKVVVEKLIEGVQEEGLLSTIPSGTNLINISVAEGICYVNFDENFLSQNDAIAEEVVLYSIVNSLTSLNNVSKVQIQVNGNTDGKVRYNLDLNTFYEFNEKIVKSGENSIGESETTESIEVKEN